MTPKVVDLSNYRTIVRVGDFLLDCEISEQGKLVVTVDHPDALTYCDIIVPTSLEPNKIVMG